jgi:hypothetical protein
MLSEEEKLALAEAKKHGNYIGWIKCNLEI